MHDHVRVNSEHTLYLAGERVVAGFYRRMDARVTVQLDQDDFLPASLDGRVACYVRTASAQRGQSTDAAAAAAKLGVQEEFCVQKNPGVR